MTSRRRTADDEIAALDGEIAVFPDGTVLFRGRHPDTILAELDEPRRVERSRGERDFAGPVRRGRRDGRWWFRVEGGDAIEIDFRDGVPIDPPPGWRESDWPLGTSPEAHARLVDDVAAVLGAYRGRADADAVVRALASRGRTPLEIELALRVALDVSSGAARRMMGR